MKYIVDHDIHLHSQLSLCSSDPKQTKDYLLSYAEEAGFSYICITDHFWDEKVPGAMDWYKKQNLEHVKEILPLPQSDKVKFHFGCECEMDKFLTLGISKETLDEFEFIIVPTTHLHMTGFTIPEGAGIEYRSKFYIERIDALLDMDLPFHKMGIAHLTTSLIMREDRHWKDVLHGIEQSELDRVFKKAHDKGIGIEINAASAVIEKYSDEELNEIFRIFKTAKKQGCKFYLGSDIHHPVDGKIIHEVLQRFVDAIGLEESDKFNPFN